ncbi:transposable element-related [Holotrichia oblita]|uniref:Transposable element-related n=1 Tax=Holotrichia oblita TaxID=644536 RepID=A0ACB9TEG3_HOLOL|nr:transposable element-related [Holotrichia oblita]
MPYSTRSTSGGNEEAAGDSSSESTRNLIKSLTDKVSQNADQIVSVGDSLKQFMILNTERFGLLENKLEAILSRGTTQQDEKVFSTSSDTPKVLWRRNNTRYDVQNVQTTRRSGRISCGFLGWMCAAGPGEIVPITGRLTGDEYTDILENVFLLTARALFPDGTLYFVQDNSPVHTSRPVRTWCDNNQDVILIPWPAKSPDLNVIENLWGLMVRQWNDTIIDNVRTVANLTENVLTTWQRLLCNIGELHAR